MRDSFTKYLNRSTDTTPVRCRDNTAWGLDVCVYLLYTFVCKYFAYIYTCKHARACIWLTQITYWQLQQWLHQLKRLRKSICGIVHIVYTDACALLEPGRQTIDIVVCVGSKSTHSTHTTLDAHTTHALLHTHTHHTWHLANTTHCGCRCARRTHMVDIFISCISIA